ncbi:AAA family ATPase [Rhizobium leguminosarum]|uniref:AAA family ATPase n=1 Tax=Rhizobium leguminosarum TaxID=384 RepID=UPI001C945E99|nr:AAA family ATPase [Rhizobium leguminosarum]MBY5325498.1 AAA family ATPase [Rhizobium leguminosarum]
MTAATQLDTNLDELRAMSPRETPASDSREGLIFGIYDRLADHENCVANVVLVPADESGAPDWDRADPTNLESLPADEWPEDEQAAMRAAVVVDQIDGCSGDTSMLVFLRENDEPSLIQIAGPEADRDIAHAIIARDIAAVPVVRPPSKFAESLAKLRGELFAPKLLAAANDNAPAPTAKPNGPATVHVINPADWHGEQVPTREWYCEGLIPMRTVTILNGDGGVGKSLLALQLAAAGAMGLDTLGMEPLAGRTLVLGAEDDADEFQRRLDDIARAHGKGLEVLSMLRLIPLADRDALLAVPDRAQVMQPTPLWRGIETYARDFKPKLIILDTAADLFGGDEIKRSQVRQFIAMLRKLAMEIDCAIVLLAHPSVQGMQSGTGTSGSTAWNNSVRSRLYLTKGDKDADPDIRIMKTMKANYGKTGDEIRIKWKDGIFVLDDGKPSPSSALVNVRAERIFRDVLSAINRSGERVAKTKGLNYAPKVMAERPDAQGLSAKLLEAAMQRLLAAGELRVVMEGPPSKPRQRLMLEAECYGAAE